MNWQEFVIAISGILAWPSVILTLVVVFKWDSWKRSWRRRKARKDFEKAARKMGHDYDALKHSVQDRLFRDVM